MIWGKEDYLRECLNQLDNKSLYEKLEKDPLKTKNKKIHCTLSNMFPKKEIDKKLFEYLYIKRPQLGRFYLPKIHKRTKIVPGRPVVSNNGTATENISAYLDFQLKSLVPKIPHILEDTYDFLKRISNINDIPANALLVSFDVVGLNPHIPHNEGIEIMSSYLNKREDHSDSTESLCQLAEIILKHNYFENGKETYH